jgi:hypothetical protein
MKGSVSLRNRDDSPAKLQRQMCAEAMPFLKFYMGRHAPWREEYIMERLVVSVDE